MKGKTQFTRQEWKGFGIEDLRFSDFVESGDCYLQPVFNQKDGNLLFDALKIKNRERLEEAGGGAGQHEGARAQCHCTVSAELNQQCTEQQLDDGIDSIDQGETTSEPGPKCKVCKLFHEQCGCQKAKEKAPTADVEAQKQALLREQAREQALLRELYTALVAPVEEHLKGTEKVLIVPHKQLFEVPWAALIDAHGCFLIERHVLRVAPSLRVAHQAAVSVQCGAKRPGHMLLVGNPWPIRSGSSSLPCAQQEAQGVNDILKRANVDQMYQYLGNIKD